VVGALQFAGLRLANLEGSLSHASIVRVLSDLSIRQQKTARRAAENKTVSSRRKTISP
jgi:hypothetical protein